MPEDLRGFNLTSISTADKATLTISAGDITPVTPSVVVAAQTGTTDNLDGIVTSGVQSPGDADSAIIYLRADAGDTITIRHNQNAAATKNILTASGSSIIMTGNVIVIAVYDVNLDTNGAWVFSFFGRSSAAYAVTNGATDRAFDANAVTLHELADVVGTLIADLQTYGPLQ